MFLTEGKRVVAGGLVFGSGRAEKGEVSFCWQEGRSLVCLWQGKGGKDGGEWPLGIEGEWLRFFQERGAAACSRFKLREKGGGGQVSGWLGEGVSLFFLDKGREHRLFLVSRVAAAEKMKAWVFLPFGRLQGEKGFFRFF